MQVDIAVIGQGIAGSTLALELLRRDISFVVIDKGLEHSASKVSSGLINPITGRNYVKSWMIDVLLPTCISVYSSFENLLGKSYIRANPIVRSLDSIEQENQWHLRVGDDGYTDYISEDYQGPDYSKWFNDTYAFGDVKGSFNIDVASMLSDFNTYLSERGLLVREDINYNQLAINPQSIQISNIQARYVICAEGWAVKNNPYFCDLSFRPAKGEVLICQIEKIPIDHILKFHKFLVPLNDDGLFWVGSNYEWRFVDNSPTEKGRSEIQSYLDTYLKVDYKIMDHLAGVRPATKYRKPLIGRHQRFSNLFILNGLGTKGISLAPYWSKRLIAHILDGAPCVIDGIPNDLFA